MKEPKKNHSKSHDVAIVGMACQLPGASDYDSYWQNLVAKKQTIQEIPADRWDVAAHHSPKPGEDHKSVSKWCGLIDDIKSFDNDFFNISPVEARHMDPQQRLLLQESWRCIEDSAIPLSTLQAAKTSVFVGAMTADYLQTLNKSQDGHNRFAILGNDHCILANRISHQLNLSGESISINAASASSLVAIHRAKSALLLGECDYAIAAGVNLNTDPFKYIVFSQAGMLSPDGQCKSFSADANGYVPGDGVAALLLMPLHRALQHKQHIYGVIKGSAINHIGSGKPITAPCANAQAAVIKEALHNAGKGINDVGYVEAHGSGTPLGDPVEIEALNRIYKQAETDVIIGTVKPNIGHLEAAAGIAGVIKALMVLKHQYIPANLNLTRVNPVLNLNNSKLKLAAGELLNTFEKPCVGVSSFGFGGVSCHLILEKFQADNSTLVPAHKSPVAGHFLLSAKSQPALLQAIKGWQKFLQTQASHACHIQDICATVATGRQQFAHRVGFLASSKDQLFNQLSHAEQTQPASQRLCTLVFADNKGSKLSGQVALVDAHHRKLRQQVAASPQYDSQKASSIFRTADFQNTLLSVAVFNALQDLQVQPDLIEQTGQSTWAALLCSEAAQLDDYLAVVLHNKKPAEVTFHHPKYPLRVSHRSGVLYPEYINHNFMRQFFREVVSQQSSYQNIIDQANALLANDERFIELLSAWNYTGTANHDLLATLRNFSQVLAEDVKQAAYAVVAANVSLNRFYQRWQFSCDDNQSAYYIGVLSELITKKILTQSAFYKISQKPAAAAVKIWAELNRRHWRTINQLICEQRKAQHRKAINKPQTLITAIKNQSAQLTQPTAQNHRMAIGHVSKSAKASVDGELNEPQQWQQFLLDYWLQGHELNWQKLYPQASFNSLSLPAYCFEKNSFWTADTPPLSDNPIEPASAVETEVAAKQPAVETVKEAAKLTSISQTIIREVAKQLATEPAQIDPDQALNTWGLDSMAYTALCEAISGHYEVRLTPDTCYGFNNLNQLIDHVKQQLPVNDQQPVAKAPTATTDQTDNTTTDEILHSPVDVVTQPTAKQGTATASEPEAVAIVGYAGTLPNARSLDEFWSHLIEGVDGITEIPASRWRWQDWYDKDLKATNKTPSKWGGFITGMSSFDAAFFGVSPQEAKLMDPQQRILLQTAWHALEHAGQQPAALAGTDSGVFIGASTSDYEEIIRAHDLAAHASTGMNRSIIANRLSYVLDIHGPSEVIDTACSSSLVAVHKAVQAIQSGSCQLALAGGVNALLTPTHYISYGKAGMLSPDGRCKTFDADANGYVRAEGVGVVVLKPLSQALKDRNSIHAVIKASGSNHGGKANALTAPNPNAQAQLIIDTYQRAGIASHSIDYIENHGTGTPLGDPIEVNALHLAFETLAADETPDPAAPLCRLASVKSHIGHLEAAAGVAGLLKVLLALKHQQLPASMHLHKLNPYVQVDAKRFEILRNNEPWPRQTDGRLRRAGISSFGFGGVNAHLVLEEHPAASSSQVTATDNKPPSTECLVLLSAKTKQALQAYAANLLDFCQQANTSLSLADVAYTSQVGRNHESERLAVHADSMTTLIRALQAYLAAQPDQALHCKPPKGTDLPALSAKEWHALWDAQQLQQLAQHWVSGMSIDWQQLTPHHNNCQRVPLPLYPFAPTRHWLAAGTESGQVESANQPAANEQQSNNQAVRTETSSQSNNDQAPDKLVKTLVAGSLNHQLQASHYLATEHVVEGQAIAPGVFSLALMCQALQQAGTQPDAVTFKDIFWRLPIKLDAPTVSLTVSSEAQQDHLRMQVAHQTGSQTTVLTSAVCHHSNGTPAVLPIEDLSTFQPLKRSTIYPQLRAVGFNYGPNFQVIKQMIHRQGQYVAKLSATETGQTDGPQSATSWLDPRLLDGALQACLVALLDLGVLHAAQDHAYLPMMVGECQVLKTVPSPAFVYVQTDKKTTTDADSYVFDVQLVDRKNQLCVAFKQLLFKQFKRTEQNNKKEPTKSTIPAAKGMRKTTVNTHTLRNKTTDYFTTQIAEAASLAPANIDLKQPFKAYGIDSFLTLTIIRNLETVFGELRKTLLFEASNVEELVDLFIDEHQATLVQLFDLAPEQPAEDQPAATEPTASEDQAEPATVVDLAAAFTDEETPEPVETAVPDTAGHQVFSEQQLTEDAAVAATVEQLLAAYGAETIALSRKDIAPWVFLTGQQSALFYFNTHQDILLAFRYVGAETDFPAAMHALQAYCQAEQLHLNVLAECPWPTAQQQGFSANAFGVVQRLPDLSVFGLSGAKMRRLRYQVNKFQQAGQAETVEYRAGEDVVKDDAVGRMIAQWASNKAGVNPYIWRVKDEMETGCLGGAYRIFLTYLDRSLQNVVIVSRIESDNSYLLDTEFYGADMATGAMDFAIHQIIKQLHSEGCTAFSLGLTFGADFFYAEQADPAVSQAFEKLAADGVFAEAGNYQFKNKFRCDNAPLYLYRSAQQPASNVLDLIMMIGNPGNTSSRPLSKQNSTTIPTVQSPVRTTDTPVSAEVPGEAPAKPNNDRSKLLAQAGHNPFNLAPAAIEFDLATDSWSELEYPFIHARTQHLQGRIKAGAPSLESVISDLFGLPHVLPFSAGRVAESFFCPAWPKGKKHVLQNVLFPTCLFHQVNNDFLPVEIIDREFLNRHSQQLFKGNMDLDLLQQKLQEYRHDVAFVWVELANNAAGGCSVSLQNLRAIKASIGDIPLVIDATRIIENAYHIAAHEPGQQGRDLWDIVHDLCACADAINASLTKDFGSHIGGFFATKDANMFAQIQDTISTHGSGLSRQDRQLLTQALLDKDYVLTAVEERMARVQGIADQLLQQGIEVVQPVGGHCLLLDPMTLPGMSKLATPLPAFVAWLFRHTGIRANIHSVGRQRNTAMNNLIRLAIPVGLSAQQADTIAARLIQLFTHDVLIDDLTLVSKPAGLFGDMKASYAVKQQLPLSSGASNTRTTNTTTAGSPQSNQPQQAATPPSPKETRHTTTDVAVIGMSGRYPDAKNLDEFWHNLCQGHNSIKQGPNWAERCMDAALPQHLGGFIDDVDKFDSLFFSISPREAQNMDPQERLMMETSWAALEDAGYHPEALAAQLGSNQVGVYVGAVWSYYEMLGAENRQQGGGSIASSQHWGISNRISSCMNFTGPSMTVDTACSSSLTAIHLACEALRQGACQVALAGGVNLDLHPSKYHITQAAQFLSDDGLCRAFGRGGSGYVAGEGVGTLVLKPLAQAEQDGDHIYGVIKGTAINHGGRTAGYTVPSPKAQAALISQAMQQAGISADTISYVEAHGTGTELGDPVEIQGASQAYRQDTASKQYCAIGSVKTNIGHLEAAAGIAGATKLLLQMQHKQLVPSLHSKQLNEHIDFANSPFYVQQEKAYWQPLEVAGQMVPRRAGLSSFGAGGTNVHVVFEEYSNARQQISQPDTPQLIILSARKAEHLQQQAQQLLQWLTAAKTQHVDLTALAHTLQVGRLPLSQRLAIIAHDKNSLINGLNDFIKQNSNSDVYLADGATQLALNLFDGSESQQIMAVLVKHGSFHKLAQLWVNGVDINWQQANPVKTHKLSLPTYPFAKESHWIEAVKSTKQAVQPAAAVSKSTEDMAIHPLLDANISNDAHQHQYRKQFTLDQFVFRDHIVDGLPTLPGVAYMEMALAAAGHASKQPVTCLKNLIWASPINSAGAGDIRVKLQQQDDAMSYEICTVEPTGGKQVHAQGKALPGSRLKSVVPNQDIEAIKRRCSGYQSKQDCYDLLGTRKLSYGDPLQAIAGFHYGDQEGLTELQLPASVSATFGDYLAHPSILDGAVQSIISLLAFANTPTQPGVPYVPFVLSELLIHKPLTRQAYAHLSLVESKKQRDDIKKINIDILSDSGEVLLQMKEFSFKAMAAEQPLEAQQQLLSQADVVVYQPSWQPQNMPEQGNRPQPEVVLLFDNKGQNVQDLQTQMPNSKVVWIEPHDAYSKQTTQHHQLNPNDAEQLQQLFDSLRQDGMVPQQVIHNLSSHAYLPELFAIENDLHHGLYSVLVLAQSLLKNRKAMGVKKLSLTYLYHCQAQSTQPSYGTVAAFMRSIKHEGANLDCQSLCISHSTKQQQPVNWAMVVAENTPGEDLEVMHQNGQRYVRQLKTVDVAAQTTGMVQLAKPNGVYLITGGAGGLGQLFARELLQTEGVRVILTGRSSQAAVVDQHFDKQQVSYHSCDLSDAEQVSQLVARISENHGRLDGVIHAAGIIKDGFLWNKALSQFAAVLSPKIMGTHHLDQATQNLDLDYFLLCSSIASSHGNMGQSDYAAGNRFMDDFAQLRSQWVADGKRSGHTVSVNWPLWQNGGMQVNEQAEQWLSEHWGMQPLVTEVGLAGLHVAVTAGLSVLGLVQGSVPKLKQALQITDDADQNPLPSTVAKAAQPQAARLQQQPTSLKLSSRDDSASLADKLQLDLADMVVDLLQIKSSDIVFADNMSTYGFDSVTFTEFANMINQRLAIDVTPLIFFEQETLDELTAYLLEDFAEPLASHYREQTSVETTEATPADPSTNSQTEAITTTAEASQPASQHTADTAQPTAANNQDIAIIGMSGVMPQSADLDVFWQNLLAEKNLVTEIPQDRWDWRKFYGESDLGNSKTEIKWGGFIPEVDKFDADFFNISPLEAELTDPQQRLFLETVWHTIEDAGYQASALKGSNTGVFVGIGTSDYHELLREQNSDFEAYSVMGWMHAVLANRISYFFNWSGPSEPIGTACSSSLVAIERAVQAIRSGRCDQCVAGGISLILNPGLHIGLGKAAMLSPDGRCKTFDHRANGYVRSEGVGALLLKPLAQAKADGDHIYAVIKGAAVNHGGHVNTFTTPNPKAQTEVLSMAFDDAGIDPATLSYIEAHGTGTALGDPIEIQGLLKAFKNKANQQDQVHQLQEYCALGSVKTNVGHLELAAGMAGMFKLVLALKNQTIPASINFEQVNPYIKLDNTPFRLATRTEAWQPLQDRHGADIPRRAGISSFGFGGVNAHLVLQEYQPAAGITDPEQLPQIITLSTKHAAGLRDYAERLAGFVATGIQRDELPALSQLAANLQQGREAMKHRLAMVAHDYPGLLQQLQAYASGEVSAAVFHSISGAESEQTDSHTLAESLANRDHQALAQAWVQGHDIDWQQLNPRREKLSLPLYPFQKNRYWLLDPAYTGAIPVEAGEPPASTPLTESVTAPEAASVKQTGHGAPALTVDGLQMRLDQHTAAQAEFTITLDHSCSYLTDHHIADQDLLPAACYLECVNQALFELEGQRAVDFLDVAWLRAWSPTESPLSIRLKMQQNSHSYGFAFVDAAGQTCCRGTVSSQANDCPDSQAVYTPQAGSGSPLGGEQTYQLFKQHGFAYGDSLAAISALRTGGQTADSQLQLPQQFGTNIHPDCLHTAMLDGALQSMLGVLLSGSDAAITQVPVSVAAIEWLKPLSSVCYVQAKLLAGEQPVFEISVYNEDHQLALLLSDVGIKPLLTESRQTVVSDSGGDARQWLAQTAAYLAQMVADETKRALTSIDHDSTFDAFGIDSFLAMRMTKKLEQVIGPVQKTVFFEHRSIAALAAYLLSAHEDALAVLFAGVAEEETTESEAQPPSKNHGANDHDGLLAATTRHLVEMLATETKRPVTEIQADSSFDSLGIDSFLSMRMTKQLEKDLGTIDKTAFFQHNTAAKLAGYLLDQCHAELVGMFKLDEASAPTAFASTNNGETADAALPALTQAFLSQMVATETKTPIEKVDINAPFEGFGIDSFLAMRMTKKLEKAMGPVSKTAFFEHRNIADFTAFLLQQHQPALAAYFATADAEPAVTEPATHASQTVAQVLTEQQIKDDTGLQQIITQLNEQHGRENLALARAAIAPLVFLAANQRALFHFNQHDGVALAFTYVGAEADLPLLAQEFTAYCEQQAWQANMLLETVLESGAEHAYTANSFGVMQRLQDIHALTLQGSKMRRLRYQISKFKMSGACTFTEYRNGADADTDQAITEMIDSWAANKKMVNPYIWDVKQQLAQGQLPAAHRIFLTHVNQQLQNVIIITELASENGYLMDLEFYSEQMPLGGLEYAIWHIVQQLKAEGCEVFSMGATFGVIDAADQATADPQVTQVLADLQQQGAFNGQGNLQFKNKFRPVNNTLYLTRPAHADPDKVVDVIMMIANPYAQQPVSVAAEHN